MNEFFIVFERHHSKYRTCSKAMENLTQLDWLSYLDDQKSFQELVNSRQL